MSPRTDRTALAAAADEYLEHDWPVAPGAWWSPQLRHYSCGRTRCCVTGPHAVDVPAPYGGVGRCEAPAVDCVVRAGQTGRWWGRHPYTLLAPTGIRFTVIEGPVELVDALDDWLGVLGYRAPRSTAPASKASALKAELYSAVLPDDQDLWLAAASAGVLIHGNGPWVTLPPSATRSGQARWVRSPQACEWQLPPAGPVADGLRRALATALPPVDVHAVAAGAVMV